MSFMYFKVWQKQYQGRGFANNIYIPFFEMRHLKIFKLFLFISIQYKKCTITYFFHPQAHQELYFIRRSHLSIKIKLFTRNISVCIHDPSMEKHRFNFVHVICIVVHVVVAW